MTDTALANATGISRQQVSRFLRGDRSPTVDQLARICAALGVAVSDVAAIAERMP